MKPTPRTKMKRLAIVLVIVTIAVVATDIYIIPGYLKLSSISWERIFRTEPLHHYFMIALGSVVFGVIPGIVIICGGSAWVIYKHLGDISDENRSA
jgi:hypothetical protein